MGIFDMRTILFGYVITTFVCLIVMFLLWLQNRERFSGMIFWVLNYALQSVSIFLIVLRGIIPDWISIVVSNSLVITGGILGLIGLEKFVGIKVNKPINYVLLVIFVILQIFLTLFYNDLTLRDLNLSITTLIIFLQCAWLLLFKVTADTRGLTFGVGIVFVAYSLVNISRIIEYFLGTHASNDYLNPDQFEKFVLFSYQILFILLTFSLALMFNKKLLMTIALEEEKFSKAFHSSPYAIVITRISDGEILEINQRFATLTGYEKAEALGKTTLGLRLWKDTEDRSKMISEAVKEGKVSEREFVFRKKTGELITTLFSAEIIHINNVKCILASVNDITERKRGEWELQESNRKINTLINNLRGVAYQCTFDKEWSMKYISDGIFELSGYRAEDFVNNRIRSYDSLIEPQDKQDVLNKIQKATAAGVPYTLEYRIETAFAEQKWVWERGRGVYENGKLMALEGFITDITERKLTEDEIRKLNDDLEKRVIKRTLALEVKTAELLSNRKELMILVDNLNNKTKQLTITASQLETVNKELEAFSYSVSHDLRAPLRALNGYTRILMDDYASVLDEEGRRLLKVILKNSKKMGNLISDLLSFSRFGRQEMANSEIDMFAMANRVFEELTSQSLKSRIKLRIEKIPPAIGDNSMVQQIWVNLISNAVKFTTPKAEAIIEIGHIPDNSQNTYYIKDNGVGFDMDYSNKLFGVFQRLHSEKEFEGTGVGLAIVKRIVLRMGGRVWAEGKINDGATFYFSLPNQIL
jgi:PAS domain S-box-containing protein